jgi:hypothetical protein
MTTKPRRPIQPSYALKSSPEIGEHVSQIAIDGHGEYAVFTNEPPLKLARLLRGIADEIEQERNG